MLTTVAALAIGFATAVVTTAPAGATGSDGIQSITVTTTPTGSVTVGQSFALDVEWTGGGGPGAPRWGMSIGVPNEVHIDGFTAPSFCSESTTVGYPGIDCDVASGGPPTGAFSVHVNLTATAEVYDATFGASAVYPEISSVSDSTTLNIVPPGLTAEVHPFKFTGTDSLFVGQSASFTGQVANGGTVAMNGVTATFDVGSELRIDSATWGSAHNACTIAGARATCAIGTMGGRSAVPVAFAVTPTAAAATSTLTLTVAATTPEQQPDPIPDTATLTRSVQPTIADLGVDVGIFNSPPGIFVGGTSLAGITVTNHGPAPATDISVVFTASDNYDELQPGFGCTVTGNTATCDLLDQSIQRYGQPLILAPGATANLGIFLTATTTTPGLFHAEVTSSAPEPEPDPTPNEASFAVPAAQPASVDLRFVSWHPDANPIVAGVATTSSLWFEADGPSRTRGFKAVVTFPATWTITKVRANIAATCTLSGATATCDLDEIRAGNLALDITAIPSAAGAGQVANATITTAYPDPDGPMQASVSYDVVDAPTVAVDSSTLVGEGDTAKLPMHLSLPSAKPVSVTCITGGWTATAGADYVETTQTVTFAPGTTDATLNVPTKQDALDEDGELVLVACGGVQNAHPSNTDPTLGLMWSLIGIIDDDPLPTIVPGAITQAEGAASTVKVPVTLSAPSGRVVSVHWQTINDDAVAPSDYTAASGTLTFQPGETSKTIAVTIKNDNVREPDEFFEVAFSNPQNATVGGFLGLGFVKILNDD